MTGPKKNWAGSHAYTAPTWAAPTSVDDVVRVVRGGTGPIHALGTRHSFTDLPDTDGTLIDMVGVGGDIAIDPDARTVTAPASTRYGELALVLEDAGWALHNMGSLPHIGIAGAAATGTHGSGDANGVLSTSVRSFRYVGADAEVHEVREGDADFGALVVGLGAFGLIIDVTLAIEPSFRVRQDVYRDITWDAFLGDVDAVTAAGYSVSVFTKWEDDLGFVLVKSRVDTDDAPVAERILDGVRDADAAPLGTDDNLTALGGSVGPWMLRLPHFRLDREPSFGAEIQSEYFVSRTDAPAALAAVRALGDDIRPHLGVTELRTAARDDLWLSPASGRDVLAIHFTWLPHPVEVGALVSRIEEVLAPFAARPHWGKLHHFDAARMAEVHPRLADARAVFERLDPSGRFANPHLIRVGARVPRVTV